MTMSLRLRLTREAAGVVSLAAGCGGDVATRVDSLRTCTQSEG